jgi:hypothetical protein
LTRPPSIRRLEHALFESLFRHAGADLRSLEAHLRELGVSPAAKSSLGRMLTGETAVPLDVLLGLVTYAGGLHEALRAWAPQAGCTVVDADTPDGEAPTAVLLTLVGGFGARIASIAEALRDGVISDAEASQLRAELADASQQLADATATLDRMIRPGPRAVDGAA